MHFSPARHQHVCQTHPTAEQMWKMCIFTPHDSAVEKKKEAPALGRLAGRRYGAKQHGDALLGSLGMKVWQAGIKHLLSDVHWQAPKAHEAWLHVGREESPKSHTGLRVWRQPNAEGNARFRLFPGNSVRRHLSTATCAEAVLPTGGEYSLQPVQLLPLPSTNSRKSSTPPVPASSTASTSQGSCRTREETFRKCLPGNKRSIHVS